jgi:hypothetical protein
VYLNPILSLSFSNNFLDLLVVVDPGDASTLSSSFLFRGKGGVHAWTSLPTNESRVVLGTGLLSTLQLIGIELVSISSSNPFKMDIGINQNVPLIRKVVNTFTCSPLDRFRNCSSSIRTSVWSHLPSRYIVTAWDVVVIFPRRYACLSTCCGLWQTLQ